MIYRYKHKENYTIISNDALRDNGISFSAKGLLAYLFSLPEDWAVYERELLSHTTDKRTAVHTALIELIEAGYIWRSEKKPDNTYDYIANDRKLSAEEWAAYVENQHTLCRNSAQGYAENQHTPYVENQHILSTNIQNTKNKIQNTKADFVFLDSEQQKQEEPQKPDPPPTEPAKTKEDAIVTFNRARKLWNESNLYDEIREIIPMDDELPNILPTFQNYSWSEIENAIINYRDHRHGEWKGNWKKPMDYGFYGFLRKGVPRYFRDNMIKSNFGEE